jgi:GLPGLI family protein
MKFMKQVFLFFSMLFSLSVFAQLKEGVVIYERKVNVHRNIQDEQMRAMIPEFRTSKHQLLFSDSSSVYKIVPEDEAPDPFNNEGGGNRMIFRMGNDGGEVFRDFTSMRAIEQTDLGAKTFIIEDTMRKRNWKLTDETKTILGYTCRKAVSTETIMMGAMRVTVGGPGGTQADSSNTPKPQQVPVEAWYAEGINVPAGPDAYGQLPGVILELNIDNGRTIYKALEIKQEVNKKDIREPKKGKRVTREEYRKMQRELMGGGGQRMIRM